MGNATKQSGVSVSSTVASGRKRPTADGMSSACAALYAGALGLLLRHEFGACPHAARRAASLFERLADDPGLDAETGRLCELMSLRLGERAEACQ